MISLHWKYNIVVGMYTPDDFLMEGKGSDEYALTLEYELQREKEKNKILEERIKNKEIFIAQMKEMQVELDGLTQKCRAELQEERRKRQQLEKVEIRNHLEKITELQHEIRVLKNRSIIQADAQSKAGPQFKAGPQSKAGPQFKAGPQSKVPSENSASLGKRELKNYRSSRNLKKEAELNLYALPLRESESGEVRARFVTHFLEMVQVYLPNLREDAEKKKLKTAWRWIKDVVKEWDDQKADLAELQDFFDQVRETLGLHHGQGTQQVMEALAEWGTHSQEQGGEGEECEGEEEGEGEEGEECEEGEHQHSYTSSQKDEWP